jgi:hypothetical protein
MMGLFSQAGSHLKKPRSSSGGEDNVDDNDDASILYVAKRQLKYGGGRRSYHTFTAMSKRAPSSLP